MLDPLMDQTQKKYLEEVLGVRNVLMPESTEPPAQPVEQVVAVTQATEPVLAEGFVFVIEATASEAELGLLSKIMAAANLPGQSVLKVNFRDAWLEDVSSSAKALVFCGVDNDNWKDQRVTALPTLSQMTGPGAPVCKKLVWEKIKEFKGQVS